MGFLTRTAAGRFGGQTRQGRGEVDPRHAVAPPRQVPGHPSLAGADLQGGAGRRRHQREERVAVVIEGADARALPRLGATPGRTWESKDRGAAHGP